MQQLGGFRRSGLFYSLCEIEDSSCAFEKERISSFASTIEAPATPVSRASTGGASYDLVLM